MVVIVQTNKPQRATRYEKQRVDNFMHINDERNVIEANKRERKKKNVWLRYLTWCSETE